METSSPSHQRHLGCSRKKNKHFRLHFVSQKEGNTKPARYHALLSFHREDYLHKNHSLILPPPSHHPPSTLFSGKPNELSVLPHRTLASSSLLPRLAHARLTLPDIHVHAGTLDSGAEQQRASLEIEENLLEIQCVQ